MKKNKIIKRLCFDAVFAAIASVLYFFKFSLPIFPSFLEINFSMIAIIIATFMLSPWDGILVILIRFVIKILIMGTSTAYVGELADIIIALFATIPSGLLYKYAPNFKGKTLISFLLCIIGWILGGVLSNQFINIPFYMKAWDLSYETLANMIKEPVSLISFRNIKTSDVTADSFMFYYQIFAVIPFNLLLSSIVVIITSLVHNKLKALYNMIGSSKEKEEDTL